MADLIQNFASKYFQGDNSANLLRSVNLGEFLLNYYNVNVSDAQLLEDPAALLNVTREVLLKQGLTDEDFVRLILTQIDRNPSLINFDMVADLVESDAYKNFGTSLFKNSEDVLMKNKFEHWLVNDSMLAHIDLIPAVDVALYSNSMLRTLAAVKQDGLLAHSTRINQINAKVHEFDETYVNHSAGDSYGALNNIAQNENLDYLSKIKSVYNMLCDKDYADFLSENLDAITIGADNSQTRNAMLTGAGLTANKVILAVSKRKGWSEEAFNPIALKFPVLQHAERFEQHAEQIKQQAEDQTVQAQAVESDEQIVVKQAAPKQVPTIKNKSYSKLDPVFDVVKTFGLTLGGATAISAVSAIPGVGKILGPALGVTAVVTAGVSAGIANYNQAKTAAQARGEELNKSEAKKIALKTGVAMIGKATPYIMSMALGPVWRSLGAGVVAARTFCNDIERRANSQHETINQIEAKQGKPKNIIGRIKNIVTAVKEKRLKGADIAKAATYGAAKGAAVWLGGDLGRELGSAIGSNVSFERSGSKLSVGIHTAQMQEDLSETKIGKLVGKFNGLRDETVEDVQPVKCSIFRGHANQLSDESLARLSRIGDIDLTEHARATVQSANHRQYIGGEQRNWYNASEQQHGLQTLRDAGVKDPEGVFRKIWSAARFESAGEISHGGYQDTVRHIIDGSINNQDVDNIYKSLSLINREGGLGQSITGEWQGAEAPDMSNLSHDNFGDSEASDDDLSEDDAEEGIPAPEDTQNLSYLDLEEGSLDADEGDAAEVTSDDDLSEDDAEEGIPAPEDTQNLGYLDLEEESLDADEGDAAEMTSDDDLSEDDAEEGIPAPEDTQNLGSLNLQEKSAEGYTPYVTYNGSDGEHDYFTDVHGNRIVVNRGSAEEMVEGTPASKDSDDVDTDNDLDLNLG